MCLGSFLSQSQIPGLWLLCCQLFPPKLLSVSCSGKLSLLVSDISPQSSFQPGEMKHVRANTRSRRYSWTIRLISDKTDMNTIWSYDAHFIISKIIKAIACGVGNNRRADGTVQMLSCQMWKIEKDYSFFTASWHKLKKIMSVLCFLLLLTLTLKSSRSFGILTQRNLGFSLFRLLNIMTRSAQTLTKHWTWVMY